jgi:hypothetical protein
MVSELRDRVDGKTGSPRQTTQHDLRHIRWERLPIAYRKHAESAALADKRVLREWRKFWSARIREVKAEIRGVTALLENAVKAIWAGKITQPRGTQ